MEIFTINEQCRESTIFFKEMVIKNWNTNINLNLFYNDVKQGTGPMQNFAVLFVSSYTLLANVIQIQKFVTLKE